MCFPLINQCSEAFIEKPPNLFLKFVNSICVHELKVDRQESLLVKPVAVGHITYSLMPSSAILTFFSLLDSQVAATLSSRVLTSYQVSPSHWEYFAHCPLSATHLFFSSCKEKSLSYKMSKLRPGVTKMTHRKND